MHHQALYKEGLNLQNDILSNGKLFDTLESNDVNDLKCSPTVNAARYQWSVPTSHLHLRKTRVHAAVWKRMGARVR